MTDYKDLWEEIRKWGEIEQRKKREKLKKRYFTKQLFKKALSFTIEDKLDEAKEFFEITTEKDPNYFLAWVNMGVLYTYYYLIGMVKDQLGELAFYKRHYDEGVECFKKALELRPYDITSLIGLGDAYRGKKEFAKSLDSFQEIIKRIPKYFENLSGIGFTFLNANIIEYQSYKNYNKALKSMRKALKYQKKQKIPINYIIKTIERDKLDIITKIITTIEIVYKALLKFSEKFPRIYIQELVDKVNHQVETQFGNSAKMSQTKVSEIAISFINSGLISAKFDYSSDSIDFLVMEEEIDELLTKFNEWNEDDNKA